MPRRDAKTKSGKTIRVYTNGTKVYFNYRSAHNVKGTVTGVHEIGTSHANTTYSINPSVHHDGEPSIIHRKGENLTERK